MGRAMLITLVLTTLTGLGAIKLRDLAMQNDTMKSFPDDFRRSSMQTRAAGFEFMPPPFVTAGGAFPKALPPGWLSRRGGDVGLPPRLTGKWAQ
jgi:hypothetical protein